MSGQVVHCGGLHIFTDEAFPSVHADDSAAFCDGADLLISEISRSVAERPGIGMGSDDGAGGHVHDVPEGLLGSVGYVDQHA